MIRSTIVLVIFGLLACSAQERTAETGPREETTPGVASRVEGAPDAASDYVSGEAAQLAANVSASAKECLSLARDQQFARAVAACTHAYQQDPTNVDVKQALQEAKASAALDAQQALEEAKASAALDAQQRLEESAKGSLPDLDRPAAPDPKLPGL